MVGFGTKGRAQSGARADWRWLGLLLAGSFAPYAAAQQQPGTKPLPEAPPASATQPLPPAPPQLLNVPPLPSFSTPERQQVQPPMPAAQQADKAKEAPEQGNGLTWDEVKARFDAQNPTLKADQASVEELRADEITAYLRPNPQASILVDQLYPFAPHYDPNHGPPNAYRPFSDALTSGNVSYLHERDHKRELRLQSAKEGTQIGQSQHEDLRRNLLFTLRSAYVNTLQAKALLNLAKADQEYYDKIIELSRVRLNDGDIALIDFERIDLQRVQYESELQTAIVNLRTAKIQLLQLLNDRTPVDAFDVKGVYDFSPDLRPLADFHQIALDTRPDLRAAIQTVQQAKTNHQLAIANGSTDPTFSVDSGTNPPLGPYIGVGVSIPVRIFDRNQGEKKRTLIDITRSQEAQDATTAQVFSDVDSAYEVVRSNIELLKPYKAHYSDEATHVRDTINYAYFHGGATLLDFLQAQSDYRTVQTAYLQLIGSYLVAAGQLDLSVGREVIP